MFVYSLNPAEHSSVSQRFSFVFFFFFFALVQQIRCPSLWVTHFLIVFIVDADGLFSISEKANSEWMLLISHRNRYSFVVCLQCIIDVVPKRRRRKKTRRRVRIEWTSPLLLFPTLSIELFHISVREIRCNQPNIQNTKCEG